MKFDEAKNVITMAFTWFGPLGFMRVLNYKVCIFFNTLIRKDFYTRIFGFHKSF